MKTRIETIHYGFLEKLVEFFKTFADLFDDLEPSNSPTIQKDVPAFIVMINELKDTDSSSTSDSLNQIEMALNLLKQNLSDSIQKYFTLKDIHYMAAFLDPSFKHLDLGDVSSMLKNFLVNSDINVTPVDVF